MAILRTILYLTALSSLSNCHAIAPKYPDLNLENRFADVSLQDRDTAEPGLDSTFEDFNETIAQLVKRNPYDFGGNNAADGSILQQAFLDMQTLVDYVAQNPNQAVLTRYFRAQDANDVNAIFNTISAMASGNPPATPQGQPTTRPMDLRDINVIRSGGGFPTLAESFDTSATSTNPQIKVYNFGWSALWKRLLQSIQCSDIGPKTNYKMHFLGSLLLHETLHFNNVAILAWQAVLQPNQCPDDQPGSFPCTSKAYGPYEAMKLLSRNGAAARLNIENYVWYALETFWLNRCPGSAPGGSFTAPKNNDIPVACKQGAKGALANLWCWIS